MFLKLSGLSEVFLRMSIALLCGGVIGFERGWKKRPAGFRTYMLVCLGSALVMMTNEYIAEVYGTGDPARLGAQVISGIGFLGAGTIITTGHNRVKGLTTAAGLWAAACIGLAIGIGYYEGAIIGTLMIVVIMVCLQSIDRRIGTLTKVMILYLEMQELSVLRHLVSCINENQIVIDDIEIGTTEKLSLGKVSVLLTIRLPKNSTHMEAVECMHAIEGVTYIAELK